MTPYTQRSAAARPRRNSKAHGCSSCVSLLPTLPSVNQSSPSLSLRSSLQHLPASIPAPMLRVRRPCFPFFVFSPPTGRPTSPFPVWQFPPCSSLSDSLSHLLHLFQYRLSPYGVGVRRTFQNISDPASSFPGYEHMSFALDPLPSLTSVTLPFVPWPTKPSIQSLFITSLLTSRHYRHLVN